MRTTTNAAGQTVLAGLGWPIGCAHGAGFTSTLDDKGAKTDFTGDVSKSLDKLLAKISETELSKALAAKIEHEFTARVHVDTQLSARIGSVEAGVSQGLGIADQVREVLRTEMRQGGLLWRGR